jgi:hypothetical protein
MNKSAKEEMQRYANYEKSDSSIFEEFVEETNLYVKYFDSKEDWQKCINDSTQIGHYQITVDWIRRTKPPICHNIEVKELNGKMTRLFCKSYMTPDYIECSFCITWRKIDFHALEAGVPVAVEAYNCIIYPISRYSRVKGAKTTENNN